MENPLLEIPSVFQLLAGSPTASSAGNGTNAQTPASALSQKRAIEKYMTPDVEFRHPMCAVGRGRDSRKGVLGVFQLYSVLSPDAEVIVDNVVFDSVQNVLYLECVQWYRMFFLPIKPAPAKLLVRLSLVKRDNLYYISGQEDFYHPEDLVSIMLPPLAPLIRAALLAGGVLSGWLYAGISAFGYWRCEEEVKAEGGLKVGGEGEPTPSEAGLYTESDGSLKEE